MLVATTTERGGALVLAWLLTVVQTVEVSERMVLGTAVGNFQASESMSELALGHCLRERSC